MRNPTGLFSCSPSLNTAERLSENSQQSYFTFPSRFPHTRHTVRSADSWSEAINLTRGKVCDNGWQEIDRTVTCSCVRYFLRSVCLYFARIWKPRKLQLTSPEKKKDSNPQKARDAVVVDTKDDISATTPRTTLVHRDIGKKMYG